MPHPTVRSLLGALPSKVDPETHLRPVAQEVARNSARAAYPEKSLARSVRHARDAATELGLPAGVVPLLESMAHEELARLTRTAHVEIDPPRGASWLTIQQGAERLNEHERTIRGWLSTTEGRRRLGWPWFTGHEWKIPEPALNPATRASYMATMSAEEPAAHVASLPPDLR